MSKFELRSRSRRYAQWIAVLAAVVAVAAIGVGSFGASSTNAALRPKAPARVPATPRNQAALVRWAAATHGAKATRYRVTTYVGKHAQATKVVGTVNQTVIAGLKNGVTYTFRVAAVN